MPPARVCRARARVGCCGCTQLAACNAALHARLLKALARRRARLPRPHARAGPPRSRADTGAPLSKGPRQRAGASVSRRAIAHAWRCHDTGTAPQPARPRLAQASATHAPAAAEGPPRGPAGRGRHLGADAERVVREELEVLRQELRQGGRLAGRPPAPHVAGRAHLGRVRVRTGATPSCLSLS